jgi:hypothetical protein
MEHRWGHRIAVDLPVRLVLSPGAVVWGRVRNVSMTGAFVYSTQLLPPGSLVSIEPTSGIGHWPSRALAATVIRACDEGAGLEWCEPMDAVPSGALEHIDNPTLWRVGGIHPQQTGDERDVRRP